MFETAILDVIVGLAFVYMLLALVCSSVTEIVSQLLKLRAKTLEMGLQRLISDPRQVEVFYAHPLIKALYSERDSKERKPAYIPSRLFAIALLDIAGASVAAAQQSGTQVRQAIAALPQSDLRTALAALAASTGDDARQLQQAVERWFDDAMDRVSGWYKRQAQKILLLLGVTVTVVLNADSINIAGTLWRDPQLRQAMVVAAGKQVNPTVEAPSAPTLEALQSQLAEASRTGLHLGWNAEKPIGTWSFRDWLGKLAGLLLTALAVSMGAPFWFDLANKFLNVRGVGKVPPKAAAEPGQ